MWSKQCGLIVIYNHIFSVSQCLIINTFSEIFRLNGKYPTPCVLYLIRCSLNDRSILFNVCYAMLVVESETCLFDTICLLLDCPVFDITTKATIIDMICISRQYVNVHLIAKQLYAKLPFQPSKCSWGAVEPDSVLSTASDHDLK